MVEDSYYIEDIFIAVFLQFPLSDFVFYATK